MALRDERRIRQTVEAGRFYDGDPLRLRRELMETERRVRQQDALTASVPRALIAPHAGYCFSLATAMRAVLPAAAGHYRRVLLLAPSHYFAFSGAAVSRCEALATPFGTLEADPAGAEQLAASPDISVREEVLAREHAVEVELPLLHYALGEVTVLPVVCGGLDAASLARLAEALLPMWGDDTLLFVSSDFTHYGRSFGYLPFVENVAENLRKLDGEAARHIAARDRAGFARYLAETGATICGAMPILLLLSMLDAADPERKRTGTVAGAANSGDLTGDWSHCVGYVSIVFP